MTPRTDNEWQKVPQSSLLLKGLPLKDMFYAKIFAETRVAQISGKDINNVHQDFNLDIPSAPLAPARLLLLLENSCRFSASFTSCSYLTMLYYLHLKHMHITTTHKHYYSSAHKDFDHRLKVQAHKKYETQICLILQHFSDCFIQLIGPQAA